MIRVLVQLDPDTKPVDLAMLEIKRINNDPLLGEYTVRIATDRVHAVGMHRVVVSNFPRVTFNSLGLLYCVLGQIARQHPDILRNEDATSSSDLARRQSRVVRALQAGARKLRHH